MSPADHNNERPKPPNSRSPGMFWNNNQVHNHNAPELYSPLAVLIFSVLFSTICGGWLFSINVRQNYQKIILILFGFLFSFGVFALYGILVWMTIGNITGAILMLVLFWNKFVGRETKFQTKPVQGALITSLIATVLVLSVLTIVFFSFNPI